MEGTRENNGFPQNTVDTYTSALVKGVATSLSQQKADLAATTVGNYALFGGGSDQASEGMTSYITVNAYSNTLTRSNTTLSRARERLAATTVGNYALFGGGGSGQATVDTYTSALVKGTANNLTRNITESAAVAVGDYALFAGGRNSQSYYATVDTYTSIG